ncbi:hypothetical protein F5X99DRAFT_369615, partial [Biscogniauxia marginata]
MNNAQRDLSPRRKKFESLSTPSAQVRFDPDLFIKMYFLTKSGAPGWSKTPQALCLTGCDYHAISKVAEDVPSLIARCSSSGRTALRPRGNSRASERIYSGAAGRQARPKYRSTTKRTS